MISAGFMAVFAYVDVVAGAADCSGVIVVTGECCALSGVKVTVGVEGGSCEWDGDKDGGDGSDGN